MSLANANGLAGDQAVAVSFVAWQHEEEAEITENILDLQAAAIRRRFSVSSELALAVASLAFHSRRVGQ
ncbi:hypothetical protein [Mesorhizobium sp. CN2-181]|uniref:hypothetical protein n=1 Tax=Mesorhizobium yinganensis TaxID=3157707 RepID=UPI0032B77277